MRLLSFDRDGEAALGLLIEREVVDVAATSPDAPRTFADLMRCADPLARLERVRNAPASMRLALDGLRLLPPVPRPGKIACIGLNYADHRREAGESIEKPAFPGMFHKVSTSLIGHEAPILRPKASEQLDFECELAVVIGRPCHRVAAADALDMVFGYTILNDGSVRDFQVEKALAAGKNFDATGGMGPWLVTADELPPGGRGLRLQTRLNGEVMQDSNTDRMIFDVAETIALLSAIHRFEPGDIISTGTCAGVGGARKPPVWLRAGDLIEMDIGAIGTLRNRVADEQ
jgi:2-keto-4-pentenoate hydratase/2-oxohepta-3-ene-1,7-dioic acid hydratase in catechol pathway